MKIEAQGSAPTLKRIVKMDESGSAATGISRYMRRALFAAAVAVVPVAATNACVDDSIPPFGTCFDGYGRSCGAGGSGGESTVDGSTPDGSTLDGSAPDGDVPDGSTLDGSAPDGDVPDGSTLDGSVPDGAVLCADPTPHTCGDTCVNKNTDKKNCGDCGITCADKLYCQSGSCLPCNAPMTNCLTVCTDIKTDNNNCGGCTVKCDPGETCTGGFCK